MGVGSAVDALKAGPHIAYVKLTIPPGFWLQQISAHVGRLPGLGVEPFVQATVNNAVRSAFEPQGTNNLEGLLWPDTYNISTDEDEILVLSTLVQQFDKPRCNSASPTRASRGTRRTTSSRWRRSSRPKPRSTPTAR